MIKTWIFCALLGAVVWGCAGSKSTGETQAQKSKKAAEEGYRELDAEQQKSGDQ